MANQYPAPDGSQRFAQPGYRNSDFEGLQLSPQEAAPSLEVVAPPYPPPLEVDERRIRGDDTAKKQVYTGQEAAPAYQPPTDKEVVAASNDAADTPSKSIWRRHPRRLIAGAIIVVILLVVVIVVPVVVTKSNNDRAATPVAATSGAASSPTSPSNPTATVVITAPAPTSSSSSSTDTSSSSSSENPAPSSTTSASSRPTTSTQQPTSSVDGGSPSSDSSTFQSFTGTSCDGSGSTGGTSNVDGTCQPAPGSGALRAVKVHGGCAMTVYSDPFCSDDRTLAPVGSCVTAQGKNVASYSIDCQT